MSVAVGQRDGVEGQPRAGYHADSQLVVRIMLRLPSARVEVAKELAKTRVDLQQKIAPREYPEGVELANSREIPEHGHDIEWLRNQWQNLHKLDRGDLLAGRVSGAVYHVRLDCGASLTV